MRRALHVVYADGLQINQQITALNKQADSLVIQSQQM
jgi:hypothetical protein